MLLRRIARPLLASALIVRGVDALQHPGQRIPTAEKFSETVTQPLGVPADPELLVRINGAVQAGAGALLAIGRFPRLSGAALAVTLLPSAAFDNQFWNEGDAEAKSEKKKKFFTGLGLLGGVLLASADTAGAPGVVWRSRNAAKIAGLESQLAVKNAGKSITSKLPR